MTTMRSEGDEKPPAESPLTRRLTRKGVTVQVEIYRDRAGKWILKVVDLEQTSHVWSKHFDSDREALEEAIRALEEEPMEFMARPSGPRDVH
jgi:hypothetical protein